MADAWDEAVGPWRAVAAAAGLRPIERGETGQGGQRSVVEFLFDGEATYLDLTGAFPEGRPARVTGAALHTWVEVDGERKDVATVVLCGKGPKTLNLVALFSQFVLAPVLGKLLPAGLRPQRLKAPQELAAVLSRHREDVAREGGTVVRPQGDPLQARFAMGQPQDDEA
jgi:hypothetical protein